MLDTETTGLRGCDSELLQLSIISAATGRVLFNRYFKPERAVRWDEAERVNGITPFMVKDELPFSHYRDKVNTILRKASFYCGYNTFFDLDMLRENGAEVDELKRVVDVMEDFAPVWGEWDDFHQSFRWKRLTVCADYFNYNWGDDTAHNSLSDCRATLYCYNKLLKLARIEKRLLNEQPLCRCI